MSPAQTDVRDYWENRLAEHEGLSGVGWLGLGESFNRWMYAVRARVFAAAVRRAAGTRLGEMRVLDVGSGTGFYVQAWRRLGARRVTASDLTSVVVRRLRAGDPGLEAIQLDIAAAGAVDGLGSYDAVSAMDVLFHIVDEEAYARALANLAALLAPGGLLLFSENFLHGPAAHASHQVSRSQAHIEGLLEGLGLERVDVCPMFWLMNTPVNSQSRLLRLWWRLLSRAVGVHDRLGFLLGAAVYPVELTLVRALPGGPSTRLMTCRKR
jgi:SAM-dependent methyltransferase